MATTVAVTRKMAITKRHLLRRLTNRLLKEMIRLQKKQICWIWTIGTTSQDTERLYHKEDPRPRGYPPITKDLHQVLLHINRDHRSSSRLTSKARLPGLLLFIKGHLEVLLEDTRLSSSSLSNNQISRGPLYRFSPLRQLLILELHLLMGLPMALLHLSSKEVGLDSLRLRLNNSNTRRTAKHQHTLNRAFK